LVACRAKPKRCPRRPGTDAPSGQRPPDHHEIHLARDLTHCILTFVQDLVTPIAQWVAWTGGDPGFVVIVIAETLRAVADGLDAEGSDV
jgi:hypothetical protein